MKRRILVTAISGNVSNGILKILQETDSEVYGCDVYDFPVGMDKVIKYWKVPFANEPGYIDQLFQKCIEYGITHLIPVNEEEIRVISDYTGQFQQLGTKILIQDKQQICMLLDKYQCAKCLAQISGVLVPDTYLYDDFLEDGRQYFVKLRNSCGSKYSAVIRTKAELEKLKVDKQDIVIQEYLPDADQEYTVGVFASNKKISCIIFKRKLEHGYTSFVELVQDRGICQIAEKIVRGLNITGYINLQLRKRNGENYIFEVNPRISGTVYFRHMLGFTDVLWWLELLDGEEQYEYKNLYKRAIGMRELSEKYVILE